MFLSQEETNMWLLTLEGKVSFHQIHIHITHTHIVTLKYTYTHSQRHMYEHIVTFEKSPQYALGHASSSPHISWSLGPGTMSVLPRGKKSGHLCTLSWTRLHISLRSLNKSLLRSKEWHPSSGKLPGGQGDHFDQELDPPSAQHHATWTMTFMPYAKLVLHMWRWHLKGNLPSMCMMWVKRNFQVQLVFSFPGLWGYTWLSPWRAVASLHHPSIHPY